MSPISRTLYVLAVVLALIHAPVAFVIAICAAIAAGVTDAAFAYSQERELLSVERDPDAEQEIDAV